MKTRLKLSLGLSALVLGGSMVGCTANSGRLASAGTRDAAVAARLAQRDAGHARDALTKGQGAAAVASAEAAVSLMPQNAGYRALLGRGYLAAGRFASARAAFADALRIDPADGRSALNLALAEIALGDWQAARATLDAHAATVAPADRGLALALAGDPDGGAKLLTEVVRAGQGSPTIRQNLALALALAGQWQGARLVAAADMTPTDVDKRLGQWATFAKPQAASDQVAALLGVRAVADPGQPAALALSAPVAPGDGEPSPTLVVAAEPVTPVDTPVETGTAMVATVPEPAAPAAPYAAPLLRADRRALKVAVARHMAVPARGGWFVQVGAFRNAAVAQDGWRRATRRMPALARQVPTSARFADRGGAFYRLSFGGFDRSGADAMCRRFRASGGACFVRARAGDQIASWVARPVQLASR